MRSELLEMANTCGRASVRSRVTSFRRAGLLFVLAGCSQSAAAADAQAEAQLLRGIAAYARRDWDAALKLLEAARVQADSPTMQAKVSRQFGLLYVEVDRPEDALEEFRVGLRLDATVEIDLTRVGPAARSLFECAGRLPRSLPRVAKLVADGHGGYSCPQPTETIAVATPPTRTPTAAHQPPPPLATTQPEPGGVRLLEVRAPGSDASGVSAATWLLAGTTVAAASVGTIFLLKSIAEVDERDTASSRVEFQDADDAARGSVLVANVAFAAAGVAAAALATYLCVHWLSDSAE